MKIKYTFADGTVSEVDVTEDVGNVIVDLDRQDYNSDHRQRRHNCSLEAYDSYGNLIASDENIEEDYIENEEILALRRAMDNLSPRQKYLIDQVYFKGKSVAEVAREEGLERTSIRDAVERALKKIKKFL